MPLATKLLFAAFFVSYRTTESMHDWMKDTSGQAGARRENLQGPFALLMP
jgi:hypothetical protein